jgi:hypothetical protein
MFVSRLAALCLVLPMTALAATGSPQDLHPLVALLPKGHLDKPYPAETLIAGGTPPYSGQFEGALPKGMSISSAGALYGTPRQAGTFFFKLDVTDSAGATLQLSYTLQIVH